MRDTLLLDSMHIPMAMRGDRSRDAYWFQLHTAGIEAVMSMPDFSLPIIEVLARNDHWCVSGAQIDAGRRDTWAISAGA